MVNTMIKLRADWQQTCPSCGTELVVDFLNQCPKEYMCPWCGASVRIGSGDGIKETRERLTEALSKLETMLNTDLGCDQ